MNDQTVIQEPTTEEESSWNSLIIDELNRLTATVKAEDPENDLDPMWHDEMREALPKIFDILDENHLLDTPLVAVATYEMLGRFIHRGDSSIVFLSLLLTHMKRDPMNGMTSPK